MSKRISSFILITLVTGSSVWAGTHCIINGKKVTLASLTGIPFSNKEDTLTSFKNTHDCLVQNNDRRLVFHDVYWYLTEGLFTLPDRQNFEDLNWYIKLLIGTAERYRQSFYLYEIGDKQKMPDVWKLTYEQYDSKMKQSKPLDLLLGMNSHITYDIAMSLIDIQTDFTNPAQYNDYRSLNPYFTEITPKLWDIVASYENGKDHSKMEMKWKGWVVNRWIIHHRLEAWENAQTLSEFSMESEERGNFVEKLDHKAYRRGKTFVFQRPVIRLNN